MTGSAMAFLCLLIGVNADPQPPAFPASTQFLARCNVADFMAAASIRADAEPWKSLVGSFRSGLTAIGIHPEEVEQVWIAADDDFPNSVVAVVRGKWDAGKLDAHWQQLIRDRKYNAKPVRDADSVGVMIDLPPNAPPLPGLPPTIIMAKAGNDAVAFGVKKERVFDVSNPSTENPKPKVNLAMPAPATIAGLWKLPRLLTERDSIFEGAGQITGLVTATADLQIQCTVACESPTACQTLLESTKVGIEQTKRVFPPLAQQQGTDPRIIRVVKALADSAKYEVEGQNLVIKAQVTGEQLRKLLAKTQW